MNNDNDFEIIDDFGDMMSNTTPQEPVEVSLNKEENKNTEEIPSFSFGDFETPAVTREEPINFNQPIVDNLQKESATFEFDGFEGVFEPQQETNVSNHVSTLEEPPKFLQNEEIIQKEQPLAAPGTVDVMSSTPKLNMDVEELQVEIKEEQPVEINPVLPNGEPVVTKTEEKEIVKEPKEEKVGKTKIVFIIILFAIILGVIVFLPQISELLKK